MVHQLGHVTYLYILSVILYVGQSAFIPFKSQATHGSRYLCTYLYGYSKLKAVHQEDIGAEEGMRNQGLT